MLYGCAQFTPPAETVAMDSIESTKLSETPLGIALVLFSLAALHQAYGISGFQSFSSPGALPMFAAAVMLIASLVILTKSLVHAPLNQKQLKNQSPFVKNTHPFRLIGLIALIALYLFFLQRLGFMVSSAFFLWVSFVFLWRCSLIRATVTTGLSLTVIYLVFRMLFKVVLPQGTWLSGWL